MSEEEKYVVVTTIIQYRMRYVVPVSELQKCNPNEIPTIDWAKDSVVCEELKEFSQHPLGEVIVDAYETDRDDVHDLLANDNPHLADWDDAKKDKFINDCWENI